MSEEKRVLTLQFGGDTIKNIKSPPTTGFDNGMFEEDDDVPEKISSPEEKKKEQVRIKLISAKMQGKREIEGIKKQYNMLLKSMEETALFADIAPVFKQSLDPIMEVFDAALSGQRPMGIPNEDYVEIRTKLYKMLMNKYCSANK